MSKALLLYGKELNQQKECLELAAHPNWHYPCWDWSSLFGKLLRSHICATILCMETLQDNLVFNTPSIAKE